MRTLKSMIKITAAVAMALLLLPLAVAAQESDSEGGGNFTGRFLVGYRSVDVGGTDTKYMEDINLDDGPRLFDLAFELKPAGGMQSFADSLRLEMTNYGGDPFETLNFAAEKYGHYDLTYSRAKSTYFYHDIILPEELGNERLSNAGDFHTFDFDRVQDRANLDLWLTDRAKLDFGFNRFTKTGNSTTTLDLQRDEFELDKPIDESLNQYNVGFQYAWDKATVVLDERRDDYTNVVDIFLPGQSQGANPTNNSMLDFYFLSQPYDYTANTHTVRVIGHPSSKLTLNGSVLVQNLDLDVTASESFGGIGPSGTPVSGNTTGAGTISRDTDMYDVDGTFDITDRFAVIGGLWYRKLDQSGDFLFAPDDNRGRWDIKTTGGRLGVQVAATSELVVSGGVLLETRDVKFGHSEGEDFDQHPKVSTDQTGFFASAGWRPSSSFRLTAEAENSSYNDPFTLKSPTDRQRFRVRGNYDLKNGFFVNGSYLLNHFKNSDSGWKADYNQADIRFGYRRSGLTAMFGYGLVDISRKITQTVDVIDTTTLLYILPIDYDANSDFWDGELRWTVNPIWTIGADLRFYTNTGDFGIDRDDLRGFVEYNFLENYVAHVGYRHVKYNEKSFNFDDYDANIAEVSIGYHW